jgi:hypothetical protein
VALVSMMEMSPVISGDGEGTDGLRETKANLRVRTVSSIASCRSREERLEMRQAEAIFWRPWRR